MIDITCEKKLKHVKWKNYERWLWENEKGESLIDR